MQILLTLYGDWSSFTSYVICAILGLILYFVVAKAIAENKLLKETEADLKRLKKENGEKWHQLHENMKRLGYEIATVS